MTHLVEHGYIQKYNDTNINTNNKSNTKNFTRATNLDINVSYRKKRFYHLEFDKFFI